VQPPSSIFKEHIYKFTPEVVIFQGGLIMIVRAKLLKPAQKLDRLITENNELISIFVASVNTAKKNTS